MCIQSIPSSLPPNPIVSSQTLISVSCTDSSMLTPPLDSESPAVTPDRSSLATEAPSLENEETEDLKSELKIDSDSGCETNEDSGNIGVKFLDEELAVTGSTRGKEVVQEGDGYDASFHRSINSHYGNCRKRLVSHQSRHDPLCSGLSPEINRLKIYDPYDFSGDRNDDSHHYPSLPWRRRSSSPPLSWFWRPPSPPPPVGAGLANMGNTCFLNAVMQCFTHTVSLVSGLHSLRDDIVPPHHDDGEFCVLSAVRDHIFHALATSGQVMSPHNLVDNLSNISSFFQRFQQEDAHEFLQCLLDKIDTCWSKCKVDGPGVSSEGDNLVKQVFGGRLVSQLYCCKCGSRSDTYEPLVDLSLEIEDVDDLDGALKSFTKMEEIDDDVKISCEKCKEQAPVKKQLLLDQAPSVAALHLKRFKGDGYYVEKVDKALQYPLELDLNPCTFGAQDENVELKYDLYAIIVHIGFSSVSGHYLCYIRSSPDKWFRIDDSKVTKVSEDVALSQQAYILFYAKKGTPWPCSLVKSPCENGVTNTTSPKSVLDNVEHTSYPNPPRECLDAENVVKTEGVSETCSTSLSRDNDEEPTPRNEVCNEELNNGKSSSLSSASKDDEAIFIGSVEAEGPTPRNEVCGEELNDGNSPSLSSASKDDEVILIGIVEAEGRLLTNDSSRKRKDDISCNEVFVDWNSICKPCNEAKSCTPASGGNIEHKINVSKRNVNISSPQSRSSSPDIYSLPEEHPEAAYPRPLKKKKVENRSPLKLANYRTKSQQDRKRSEALRSLSRFPSGRRQSLAAALHSVRNEGSTGRIRKHKNNSRTW